MDKLYYHVKKSTDLSDLPKIKGMDFDEDNSLQTILSSFSSTGLQASELGKALSVTNMMIREKIPIYFSFTSNMISSGIRDIIMYLTKHKKIAVLSTAAGGVEEDIIKSKSPFRLGTFEVSGSSLFEEGVARIGNVYATNEQYSYLEYFMTEVFDQMREKKAFKPSDMCAIIGRLLERKVGFDHESSYLYWAYKNNISVYCPGIVDGAIGDYAYYYRQKHPDFTFDVVGDHKQIIDYTLQQERTGALILGGGISKHYILNANIFKEGFDYTVVISTAQFFDGSDSGGNVEESISWAKIKVHSPRIKVCCDASIAFPLLVAGTFAKKEELKEE